MTTKITSSATAHLLAVQPGNLSGIPEPPPLSATVPPFAHGGQARPPIVVFSLVVLFLLCCNSASAQYGHSSYRAPSYRAPVYRYVAPVRTYVPPRRTYIAPRRTYIAPRRTYVAPRRTYVAPRRTYVAPRRTYVAPRRTYVAPRKTYVAPRTTYVAPRRTLVTPKRTFVAPKTTYVAPKRTFVAPKTTYVAPKRTYVAPKRTTFTTSRSVYSAPKKPVYIAPKRTTFTLPRSLSVAPGTTAVTAPKSTYLTPKTTVLSAPKNKYVAPKTANNNAPKPTSVAPKVSAPKSTLNVPGYKPVDTTLLDKRYSALRKDYRARTGKSLDEMLKLRSGPSAPKSFYVPPGGHLGPKGGWVTENTTTQNPFTKPPSYQENVARSKQISDATWADLKRQNEQLIRRLNTQRADAASRREAQAALQRQRAELNRQRNTLNAKKWQQMSNELAAALRRNGEDDREPFVPSLPPGVDELTPAQLAAQLKEYKKKAKQPAKIAPEDVAEYAAMKQEERELWKRASNNMDAEEWKRFRQAREEWENAKFWTGKGRTSESLLGKTDSQSSRPVLDEYGRITTAKEKARIDDNEWLKLIKSPHADHKNPASGAFWK